ncbi:hypothetical protein PFICI_00076 [Pestalotiopsis fici W106-1]|uniref:DUF7708 domain-containing protein n=1 Tax=Pestalotiopsis fici (strain W106-1 / CGMCC3.15140) TaxID=1229662 RepID=W3XJQ0_PESFW|nr:uncharacterized protein PFICI_00076 [Pestalotiopsis fici W106-1]ETS86248.1 hypothetical protein PFICI_00076 [Pestalotiopsis fici W106-1]
MDATDAFGHYYRGDVQNREEIAKNAYSIAKAHLEQTTSLKNHEKAWLFGAPSIEDAQRAVAESMANCEAKHDSSKVRKWLHRASELICHYGTVLDVFVQHHPEYVSLVWGLWKLIFTSILNHGETLRVLAKSITQIGERLPRIRIASELYPTGQMRIAMESLYVEILGFLMKAYGWCNESILKRVYHSVARPPALQYGDTLERIEICSNSIAEIATLASQAELRVMHTSQDGKLADIISKLETADREREAEFRGLHHLVSTLSISHEQLEQKVDLVLSLLHATGLTINDLLVKTTSYHSIQMNAHVNTNERLSDMQVSQALAALSSSFQDPYTCYQQQLLLRKRRAAGIAPGAATNEFWLSPELRAFASNRDSDMIILAGAFNIRAAIKDFGVDVISSLTRSKINTVWALDGANNEGTQWSSADLLRYLTWQVLRACNFTEKQMSVRFSQFQTSQTPQQWMQLFKEAVKHVGDQLYLVVDLVVIQASLATADGFNIVEELNKMMKSESKGATTLLKIIVISYNADWHRNLPSEIAGSVIPVTKAASRKVTRTWSRTATGWSLRSKKIPLLQNRKAPLIASSYND